LKKDKKSIVIPIATIDTNRAENIILNVIEIMDFIIVGWLISYVEKLYSAIMKGT
tara:strand:- start:26933 stop:27097 length:165 start_codon:yes stop_codon:yes gene_type:complete